MEYTKESINELGDQDEWKEEAGEDKTGVEGNEDESKKDGGLTQDEEVGKDVEEGSEDEEF